MAGWDCGVCTYTNTELRLVCDMCLTVKPHDESNIKSNSFGKNDNINRNENINRQICEEDEESDEETDTDSSQDDIPLKVCARSVTPSVSPHNDALRKREEVRRASEIKSSLSPKQNKLSSSSLASSSSALSSAKKRCRSSEKHLPHKPSKLSSPLRPSLSSSSASSSSSEKQPPRQHDQEINQYNRQHDENKVPPISDEDSGEIQPKKWRKKKRTINKYETTSGEKIAREVRAQVLGVLEKLIGNSQCANAIEVALYDQWKYDTTRYKQQVRNLAMNLRDVQNPELKTKILQGELTPSMLSTAQPEDLANESLKAKREELAAEGLRDATRENTLSMLIQQKIRETRNRFDPLPVLDPLVPPPSSVPDSAKNGAPQRKVNDEEQRVVEEVSSDPETYSLSEDIDEKEGGEEPDNAWDLECKASERASMDRTALVIEQDREEYQAEMELLRKELARERRAEHSFVEEPVDNLDEEKEGGELDNLGNGEAADNDNLIGDRSQGVENGKTMSAIKGKRRKWRKRRRSTTNHIPLPSKSLLSSSLPSSSLLSSLPSSSLLSSLPSSSLPSTPLPLSCLPSSSLPLTSLLSASFLPSSSSSLSLSSSHHLGSLLSSSTHSARARIQRTKGEKATNEKTSSWTCSVCTFAENPTLFLLCAVCDTERVFAAGETW